MCRGSPAFDDGAADYERRLRRSAVLRSSSFTIHMQAKYVATVMPAKIAMYMKRRTVEGSMGAVGFG